MGLTMSPQFAPSFGFENLPRFPAAGAIAAAPAREQSVAGRLQGQELSPEEERVVTQLQETDRRVRAHERAHLAVGADLVRGGASFTYELGPDRRRYAVAGEVSIDTSPGRTPEETVPKAQHIRATALAPADPSSQDYRVAAMASRMEMAARQALASARAQTSEAPIEAGAAMYDTIASGVSGFRRIDLYA